jgi:hypothetical protein
MRGLSMSDPKLSVGTNFCKCAACGRYFTGPTAFDIHRFGEPEKRVCRDPSKILDKDRKPRLRLNDRGYWASARRRVDYQSD